MYKPCEVGVLFFLPWVFLEEVLTGLASMGKVVHLYTAISFSSFVINKRTSSFLSFIMFSIFIM